jgi:hypothetical protein
MNGRLLRAGLFGWLTYLALEAALPARAQDKTGEEMFSISVDGEHVAGTAPQGAEPGNAPAELGTADIQVKYDGLGGKPILNAATSASRRTFAVGEEIEFLASSNYPAYIARSEIRIFAKGRHAPDAPIAVVPVGRAGRASWTMPDVAATQGYGDFFYVLRVYDRDGRFDETRPLTLARRAATDVKPEEPGSAPGYSDDNTAFRNIQVDGGAITVSGRDIPAGARVKVLGEDIPVDAEGRFVVQRILPVGESSVDVALVGEEGGSINFERSVNIPSSEWFYVGMADVTFGKAGGSKNIEEVKPGEYDDVYNNGRISFYLKGKIKGSYLLTAAADTGNEELKNLFSNLDAKDPRSFLQRIDPEDYYPVYGDDSVAIEDAPTQGKFYVRLERGDNRVVWGNFKTDVRGTEFLRNDRALYGANLVLKSDKMVASGERAGELNAYAAQPGTLPFRDVLRGTGGSAYFLSHQDLTVGSETAFITVRNPVTGQVTARTQLVYGRDYSIDYFQGIVLLNRPLASTVDIGNIVRDGAIGGYDQYLEVAYEYTPSAGDVDGYVYGGRAQQWIGNNVRLGVTGAMENTGPADQKLIGGDIQFYKSERTFLEGEVAMSEGPGFGFSESLNGGLTGVESGLLGSDERAMAYRVLGRLDVSEIVPGAKGDLQASYAYKEKGFSSLEEIVSGDRHEVGFKGDIALNDRLSLNLYGDYLSMGGDVSQYQAGGDLTYMITEDISIAAGAQQLDADNPEEDTDGQRTDAALRITRVLSETSSIYAFGQATLDRSGDIDLSNRGGIGGTYTFTDTLDGTAEVSYGSNGAGGRALLNYRPVAADRYYIGYALDSDNRALNDLLAPVADDGTGGIVAGVSRGFSERLSAYSENVFDFLADQPSLTQVYGVRYTPVPEWKLGGAIESGMIWGDTAVLGYDTSELRRTALSATAVYSPNEDFVASLKGEIRFDEDQTDGGEDITAYYIAGRYSDALNANWRFLASADVVLSDANETLREGDYVDAAVGYAYRPVDNDRLNALARYNFVYNTPTEGDEGYGDIIDGPAQRSHIFSVDATYDLTKMLSVGGKYGLRIGEWNPDEEDGGDGGWQSSNAQLAVLRADFHVVKEWDLMLEGRALWESESQSADLGAVATIYRQIGENLDLGIGYNFGRFSDDLRDLTADDYGFFVNVVGKI